MDGLRFYRHSSRFMASVSADTCRSYERPVCGCPWRLGDAAPLAGRFSGRGSMDEFVRVNKHSNRWGGHPIGYFIRTSGCWEWSGAVDRNGYGRWGPSKDYRGKSFWAHRRMYEVLVGEIPAKHHLDHLCCNVLCVNPAHLEPVSPGENSRRSSNSKMQAHLTGVCGRGHVGQMGQRKTGTYCRRCSADGQLRRKRNRRAMEDGWLK